MAKKVIEEDFATRKLEIISPDEMKKRIVKKTKKVKEEQPRKKSNVGGYFILVLLLIVAGGLTYYWYKEVYKKDTGVVNEVVDKNLGYSFVTYKSDKKLRMINDSYVIEYEDNKVASVSTYTYKMDTVTEKTVDKNAGRGEIDTVTTVRDYSGNVLSREFLDGSNISSSEPDI